MMMRDALNSVLWGRRGERRRRAASVPAYESPFQRSSAATPVLLSDAPASCEWLVRGPVNAAADATTLQKHGLLVVRGVAAAELCSDLLSETDRELEVAKENPTAELFCPVHDARLRHSLKLHATEAVMRVLRSVCTSSCGDLLTVSLGPSATLCELSAISTEAGAGPQPAHCDTVVLSKTNLLTVFVALADVESSMGPTIVWPGTHTDMFHSQSLCRGVPLACGWQDRRRRDRSTTLGFVQ